MSKLFTLKEWLTVPESARHLSRLFNEEVVESDVLRLVLDGRLRLSVHFVNNAFANPGKFVEIEEIKWHKFEREIDGEVRTWTFPEGVDVGHGRWIVLDGRVVTLEGVWDLPLIGGERFAVENEYQQLTNGPTVMLANTDGVFVQRDDGIVCRLCEPIKIDDLKKNSLGYIKTTYYELLNGITAIKDDDLILHHEAQRKKAAQAINSLQDNNKYYLSSKLPLDGVLVVRAKNLASFVSSLEEQNDAGQPEDAAKRGTPITDGYSTKLLELLLDGAKQWWSSYDPADSSTAPKSADVTSWFVEKGAPQRVAEVMAQILRADGLPTGPRGSK